MEDYLLTYVFVFVVLKFYIFGGIGKNRSSLETLAMVLMTRHHLHLAILTSQNCHGPPVF